MGCGNSSSDSRSPSSTETVTDDGLVVHRCGCGAHTLYISGTADVKGFNCECGACQRFYGASYDLWKKNKGNKQDEENDIKQMLVEYRKHPFAELIGMYDRDQVHLKGETETLEDEGSDNCHGDTVMKRHRCKLCKLPVYAELMFSAATLVVVPWRTLQDPRTLYLSPTDVTRGKKIRFGAEGCINSRIAKAVTTKRLEAIQKECAVKYASPSSSNCEGNDDGKGNKAKVMTLPQNVLSDTAKKERSIAIAGKAAEYAWKKPAVGPIHVANLPDSEKDPGEVAWHNEQVKAALGGGLQMFIKGAMEDVGDVFQSVFGAKEGPFEDFSQMYEKGKVPLVANRWQEDAEFARQKLQGILPIYIKKVPADGLPDKFPAESRVDDFKGWPAKTWNQMLSEGRLYWVDYEFTDSVLKADTSKESTKRNMCSPMMLFFVDELDTLMPACVKLRQESTAPVICSGGQDLLSNRWRVAKILCNSTEGALHEVSNHLLMTHYAIEVIIIALKTHLSVNHPVHELLSGHCWYTLFINEGARTTLTGNKDSPVPKIMCMGFEALGGLLQKGWDQYSMRAYDLEGDCPHFPGFKTRDVESLPGYYYRDDARKIQASIRGYVKNILGEFYKTDADVTEDFELQAFVQMVVDPAVGNMRGSVFETTGGKATTIDQLLTFCTHVIWAGTGYHAALNNGQYDYYGFIPNAPGIFDISPDALTPDATFTLEQIASALPKKGMALYQVSFINILSLESDQELGSFKHDPYYFKAHPSCLKHLETWQEDLKALSVEIDVRNDELEKQQKVPYPYLNPKHVASSVDI